MESLKLKNSISGVSLLAMFKSRMETTKALLEKINRNYPTWRREKDRKEKWIAF